MRDDSLRSAPPFAAGLHRRHCGQRGGGDPRRMRRFEFDSDQCTDHGGSDRERGKCGCCRHPARDDRLCGFEHGSEHRNDRLCSSSAAASTVCSTSGTAVSGTTAASSVTTGTAASGTTSAPSGPFTLDPHPVGGSDSRARPSR